MIFFRGIEGLERFGEAIWKLNPSTPWKFSMNTKNSNGFFFFFNFVAGNTFSKPLLLVSINFQQFQIRFPYCWDMFQLAC